MHSPNGSAAIRLFLLGTVDARMTGGASLTELINQPKRLALIVYLALAPEGRARRRDELLAMFFPESREGPARNALNQTIYRLRAVLGEDALFSNDQEVRINRDRVWCDAAELRDAAAGGDDARVLSLYRGALLESFHARGTANEFEDWLAAERAELRDLAVHSAWRASAAAEAMGDVIGAAEHARAAVRFAPTQEDSVRRLMVLLENIGDRGAALRAYDEYARRLVDEFELEPAPQLARLATVLRDQPESAVRPAVHHPNGPVAVRKSAPLRAAAVGLLLVLAIVAGALMSKQTERGVPVLAVGDISSVSIPDTLPVDLLLSTSLARIEGLSVITEERVREVAAQLARAQRSSVDTRRAALEAGAREVVEGVISRRGETYRLDFRRVDASARAVGGHVVEANDLHDLIDLATEHVARDLGLRAPATRADASTASLVAYRLYQQGLTALYSDDAAGANRLFTAALAEDSTFAMAAYQLAVVTAEDRDFLFERAMAAAAASPDRERLVITALAKRALSQPGALAVAESAATRYPRDPEALMAYAGALQEQARFIDAAHVFRKAAELDSMSIYTSSLRCRACEARRKMRESYIFADSAGAAEREARAWLRRNPKSRHAWSEFAQTLEQLERFEEADSAFVHAPGPRPERDMTGVWIRKLRFADVDLHWQNELRTGEENARKSAHWGAYISMRTQGRLQEALTHARAFRDLQGDSLLEGLALFELGRYREAAHIHEKHAARWAGDPRPAIARRVAWHLTHAAASYAALRDTAKLREIEETVREHGALSTNRRDQLLHHYIRGLRLRVMGRERDAAAAFEASITTLNIGNVRAQLELARASLATGNPRRAISVLRPALLGPIASTGLYASRTELMELLGDAYALDHQQDSARAVYGRVLESWKNADPALQPRVQAVRARLKVPRPDR